MLCTAETIQVFGYDPTSLSFGSKKKVVVKCDYCQTILHRGYGRYLEYRSASSIPMDTCTKCKSKKQHESIRQSGGMKEIQARREATNLQKYGTVAPANNPEIQEKIQQSNLIEYGTRHAVASPQVQKKIKTSILEKYGTENVFSLPEIREKSTQTMIAKYGKAHAVKYGKTEAEILKWLNANSNGDFAPSHKILSPQHLDAYSPSHQLAVEFCGLYWHCEDSPNPRGRRYHFNKYAKCKEQNIRLITIFQDEWSQHSCGVKNYMRSLLLPPTRKFHARKCQIRPIDADEAKDFLNGTHIQGYAKCFIAMGIFDNRELLGVMTFSKHHRQGIGDSICVLSRMAFASDCMIVGGASRLLDAAVVHLKTLGYDKIVSWSDNRYSEGNVYSKLGFQLEKEYGPDYAYVDLKKNPYIRISKQSCKKKNLGASPTQTEKEKATELGLSRIWDCGKKKWSRNIS